MEAAAHKLINAIRDELPKERNVNSIVLKGSRSRDVADEWSDIDIAIGVREGAAKDAFNSLAKLASTFGPLDYNYEIVRGLHRIFHIECHSHYLVLEASVWFYDEYTPPMAHIPQRFSCDILFDRLDRLRHLPSSPDLEEVASWLNQLEFEIAEPFLASRLYKHLKRGHVMAAMMAYQTYVLKPLLRAYRLRDAPATWLEGTSSVDRDLRPGVLLNIPVPRSYTVCSIQAAANVAIADLRRLVVELKREWAACSDCGKLANPASDTSRHAA